MYDGLSERSNDEWFHDGLRRATLAGLAGRDGAGVSAAEGKAEADQAMALLRKAVGMGYRDAVAVRTDSALDPLRQREDFQKAARGAGAEIGRQAEVTERLRDRGGYRIGREWKR